MGLFDKLREPIVLKENSDAKAAFEQLDNLLKIAPESIRERIEEDKKLLYYGIKGEESLMFELKNSHMPMYILHDVFFEENGLKTQIDYIVVTRKLVLIIECKNLYGNISIDSQGNFTRTIKCGNYYHKEGIYSPITQNQRHIDMIREKRRNSKGIFGKMFFDRFFENNYKSIVVLANPKSVLDMRYAPKEIKSQIVKVDGLNNYIKKLNNDSSNEDMSDKQMKEMADFFLLNSVHNNSDFISKYYDEINITFKSSDKEKNIAREVSFNINDNNSANEMIFNETKIDDFVNEAIDTKANSDINNERVILTEKINDNSLNNNFDSEESENINNIEELPVYKALKDYRYKQSKIEKIKAYYIFNNAQLKSIIEAKPKTINELKMIKGFAEIKCSKYGEDILRILKEY